MYCRMYASTSEFCQPEYESLVSKDVEDPTLRGCSRLSRCDIIGWLQTYLLQACLTQFSWQVTYKGQMHIQESFAVPQERVRVPKWSCTILYNIQYTQNCSSEILGRGRNLWGWKWVGPISLISYKTGVAVTTPRHIAKMTLRNKPRGKFESLECRVCDNEFCIQAASVSWLHHWYTQWSYINLSLHMQAGWCSHDYSHLPHTQSCPTCKGGCPQWGEVGRASGL